MCRGKARLKDFVENSRYRYGRDCGAASTMPVGIKSDHQDHCQFCCLLKGMPMLSQTLAEERVDIENLM